MGKIDLWVNIHKIKIYGFNKMFLKYKNDIGKTTKI